MDQRKRPLAGRTSEIIKPPAFPVAGHHLLQQLGTALSKSRGYALKNIDLARIMGRSKSTTSYWFGVFAQPHLVSFFCLLEQLPQPDRHQFVENLCRELPTLDHPRLRHNPAAVTALKALLKQDAGLTLLVGGSDEQRTFVVTALGQTFCRIDPRHRTAVGIDLHQPDWFAPIETLLYLKGSAEAQQAAGPVRRVWPQIVNSAGPLVLLNGVWSVVPELRSEILRLAQRSHVIVADQHVTPGPSPATAPPRHIISIEATRESLEAITVRLTRA